MCSVAFLQLSWLAAVSRRRTWIPDQAPTPVPGSISASTVAGLPLSAKSAVVQAGLLLSAPPLTEVSEAVTWWTKTLPLLGLSKLPDRVPLGPPGYRPAGVEVWLTVMDALLPEAAVPLP